MSTREGGMADENGVHYLLRIAEGVEEIVNQISNLSFPEKPKKDNGQDSVGLNTLSYLKDAHELFVIRLTKILDNSELDMFNKAKALRNLADLHSKTAKRYQAEIDKLENG